MIFVHGHKFIEKDGEYYTTGCINEKIFDRYLNVFESVEVVANVIKYSKKNAEFIYEKNKVSNVKFDLIGNKNNLLKIIKIFKTMKKKIITNKHIVFKMPSIYSMIGIYYATKIKKNYLVELVGCPWDALWNHSIKGKVAAPFMWYMTKKMVKRSPYVIYVTNRFLQKRYPTKGNNIGCSDVALPSKNIEVLDKRIKKINNMDKCQAIKIGTAAAINVRYKGHKYVIKAISILNKKGYNFEYFLAGGGDDRYLKLIAEKYHVSDKIKFLGLLPREEIFNYFDDIDIYVQPSKQEGLPRALIEAMSRGCPVLGSIAGGIPELLSSKVIFNRGDVKSTCNILKSFNLKTMVEEAKRSFNKAQEYDKEILDKKRTDFYKEYQKKVENIYRYEE